MASPISQRRRKAHTANKCGRYNPHHTSTNYEKSLGRCLIWITEQRCQFSFQFTLMEFFWHIIGNVERQNITISFTVLREVPQFLLLDSCLQIKFPIKMNNINKIFHMKVSKWIFLNVISTLNYLESYTTNHWINSSRPVAITKKPSSGGWWNCFIFLSEIVTWIFKRRANTSVVWCVEIKII